MLFKSQFKPWPQGIRGCFPIISGDFFLSTDTKLLSMVLDMRETLPGVSRPSEQELVWLKGFKQGKRDWFSAEVTSMPNPLIQIQLLPENPLMTKAV